MNESRLSVRPPGLIRSLAKGFDVIAGQLSLVLFPVVLDALLWLGPRLRIFRLFEPTLQELAAAQKFDPQLTGQLREMFQQYNLFSVLRTLPIGIPSLMVSRPETGSPLGTVTVWDVPDLRTAFGYWLFLTLLGLVGGAVYFLAVAQVATNQSFRWREILRWWPWTVGQVLFLTLLWICLIALALFPLSCVASLFLFNGTGMGEGVWLFLALAGGMLLWLFIPLVFSSHGIFAMRLPIWQSIQVGVRLARMNLISVSTLLLLFLILLEGLDLLWNRPAGASWWLAVGITGHAFVSTALLAASFVYYREALNWAEESLKNLRNMPA